MSAFFAFLNELWNVVKNNVTAIAMMIWNYEEYKVQQEKIRADKLQYQKDLEDNANEVDSSTNGESDDDVINSVGNGSDADPNAKPSGNQSQPGGSA